MGVCLSCISLVSIVIPDSVTSIGSEVFLNCHNLSEIILNSVVPPVLELGKYSNRYDQFEYNAQGRKIKVPAASLQAYKTAPGWSDYAADIIAQ